MGFHKLENAENYVMWFVNDYTELWRNIFAFRTKPQTPASNRYSLFWQDYTQKNNIKLNKDQSPSQPIGGIMAA